MSLELLHDPSTCTRVPCGRCKPQEAPNVPPPIDYDIATPTDQQIRSVSAQAVRWRDAADLWAREGAQMLAVSAAWEKPRDDLLRPSDGADEDQDQKRREARSDRDRNDAVRDAQASTYRDELARILKRVDADLGRLERLHEILCPDQPERLRNRDLLAVQVAADGWCVSCHRDNAYCEPVWKDRSRDGCQWCTKWRQSEGQWPPVALVRWRHRNPGRALTTADVARLMGKAS